MDVIRVVVRYIRGSKKYPTNKVCEWSKPCHLHPWVSTAPPPFFKVKVLTDQRSSRDRNCGQQHYCQFASTTEIIPSTIIFGNFSVGLYLLLLTPPATCTCCYLYLIYKCLLNSTIWWSTNLGDSNTVHLFDFTVVALLSKRSPQRAEPDNMKDRQESVACQLIIWFPSTDHRLWRIV